MGVGGWVRTLNWKFHEPFIFFYKPYKTSMKLHDCEAIEIGIWKKEDSIGLQSVKKSHRKCWKSNNIALRKYWETILKVRFVEDLPDMYRICLIYSWDLPEICLRLAKRCLRYAWYRHIHIICLRYTLDFWYSSEIYIIFA